MTLHTLKCWPAFYDATASGAKTFEIRLNDRGFQPGDQLVLCRCREDDHDRIEFPVDKDGKDIPGSDPVHMLTRTITYCLPGPIFGLMAGYVIMGLKED